MKQAAEGIWRIVPQKSKVDGTWLVVADKSDVHVEFNVNGKVYRASLGPAPADMQADAPAREPMHVFSRNAGRIACFGGSSHAERMGRAAFEADALAAQQFSELFPAHDLLEVALAMTLADAPLDLARAAVANFPHVDPERIAGWAAVGTPASYIEAVAVALPNASTFGITSLAWAKVSTKFLYTLNEMRTRDLNSKSIIELKEAGATEEYLSDLQAFGYADISIYELIMLKHAGVDREYVKSKLRPGQPLPALSELARQCAEKRERGGASGSGVPDRAEKRPQ